MRQVYNDFMEKMVFNFTLDLIPDNIISSPVVPHTLQNGNL